MIELMLVLKHPPDALQAGRRRGVEDQVVGLLGAAEEQRTIAFACRRKADDVAIEGLLPREIGDIELNVTELSVADHDTPAPTG